MAKIKNLEENIELSICLIDSSDLDYSPQRSDYENWIPFFLKLKLPNRCSIIGENIKATVTLYEIKDFIQGLERVLEYLDAQENYIYEFNSSESFFGIRLEIIPEDNIVEIELWINVGNQSQGEICGFDEGVRFVSNKKEISEFLVGLKQELYNIKDLI